MRGTDTFNIEWQMFFRGPRRRQELPHIQMSVNVAVFECIIWSRFQAVSFPFSVVYVCFDFGFTTLHWKLLDYRITKYTLSHSFPLACQEPGIVTGKVRSSTGNYLGETSFEYVDEVPDILQQLEHDKALHETFFHLWSQGLGNKTDEREKQQPSQPAPSFKTEGMFSLKCRLCVLIQDKRGWSKRRIPRALW